MRKGLVALVILLAAAAMGLGPALQEPAGPVMVNLSLTKAMQG